MACHMSRCPVIPCSVLFPLCFFPSQSMLTSLGPNREGWVNCIWLETLWRSNGVLIAYLTFLQHQRRAEPKRFVLAEATSSTPGFADFADACSRAPLMQSEYVIPSHLHVKNYQTMLKQTERRSSLSTCIWVVATRFWVALNSLGQQAWQFLCIFWDISWTSSKQAMHRPWAQSCWEHPLGALTFAVFVFFHFFFMCMSIWSRVEHPYAFSNLWQAIPLPTIPYYLPLPAEYV